MRRLALFFFILFISISTVNALDFSVSGYIEVDTFRCMRVEKNIFIYNQEKTDINVGLVVDGKASSLIKLSDVNFIISSNSVKNISIFYDIPCNIPEGVYDLDIYVYTTEEQKTLSQNVNVYTTDVLFTGDNNLNLSAEITPCAIAEYNLRLNNPAGYDEEYKLNINSIDFKENEFDYESSFSILANSNKLINIKISPDDCRKYGDFLIDLTVRAKYADLEKKFPLKLNIKAKGIPQLIPVLEKVRTDRSENELEIEIKHLGENNINYAILVDGPSWVSTDISSLNIYDQNTSSLRLLFNPNNSTEEKEYPVNLKLVVSDTGVSYDYNFTIRLKDFSFFERKPYLLWVPLTIIILLAALVTGYLFLSKTKQYKNWVKKFKKKLKESKARAVLKKKKSEEDKKKKVEEKKNRLEEIKKKIEEKKKKKEEKKEKKKQAYFKRLEAKQNKKSEHKVKIDSKKKVKSEIKSNLQISQKRKQQRINKFKFPWFIVYIIFAFVLIGLFRLIGLIIILVFIILLLFNQFKKTKVFSKKWKFLDKNFSIFIDTKWKTGIVRANMVVLKNLEKFSLTIRKFKQKLKGYKIFSCFDISVNIENSIKFSDVKLRISKKWFKRKNIEVDDFKLLKRIKDRWMSQKIEFIRSDKNFFYFSAEKLTAGEFVFAGKPLPKEIKNKKGLNILWIAIIGIIALFVVQPLLSFDGIPEQVIAKDSQHKMDLKSYFYDPDFDSLSFSAEKTEHINIVFDRSIAILTPESSWTGIEYTKFYAVDSEGSTASSNSVKLVVKDSIFFDKNLITLTNLIILALLVFLVLIVLFEKKPKQE